MQRLAHAGFTSAFVRAAVLPDWWGPECERDPALVRDLEFRLARFLGRPLEEIQGAGPLTAPTYPTARLRHVRVQKSRLRPALHAGLAVAGAAVRSRSKESPSVALPVDPSIWRKELLQAHGRVDLQSVVSDLWGRGVAVLHAELLPAPRYQGMACVVEGQPAILLGADRDEPAWLLFTLLHEAGHVARGDCDASSPLVDEADDVVDDDEMELAADRYALSVLGDLDRSLPGADVDPKQLAAAAYDLERTQKTDAGSVALLWARQHADYMRGQMALAALWRDHGGKTVLRQATDDHVDVGGASDTDRPLLRCLFGDPERDAGSR